MFYIHDTKAILIHVSSQSVGIIHHGFIIYLLQIIFADSMVFLNISDLIKKMLPCQIPCFYINCL